MAIKDAHECSSFSTRGWVIRGVLLCLVLGPACAGRWLATITSRPPARFNSPPIIVLEDTLSFGDVWEDQAFKWRVEFQNISDRSWTIGGIRPTCTCVTCGAPSEVVLRPGERCGADLVIDLRDLRRSDSSDVRRVSVALTADEWLPGHPKREGPTPGEYSWTIEGRVRRLVHSEPFEGRFGHDLVQGIQGPPKTFRVRADNPRISTLSLGTVPQGWKASLEGVPKSSTDFQLRTIPLKNQIGSFEDNLVILPIAKDGRHLTPHQIRLTGYVTGVVEVLPRPLELGTCRVGEVARGDFTIIHRQNKAFLVERIVCTDRLATFSYNKRDGGHWLVTVRRLVDAGGPRACSGTVSFREGRTASKTVPFDIRWYGQN